MANRYFSQYLLNKGVFTLDNAGSILARSLDAVPELSVLVLERGLVDAAQALELASCGDFIEAALSKGYLASWQLEDLKDIAPGRRACMGQVLLDEGIVDLPRLAGLFEESSAPECNPVKDVVESMLLAKGIDGGDDYEHIADYVELFLDAMQRFMNKEALILPGEDRDSAGSTYLIYQSMGGDLRLTVGCRLSDDVLLAMASSFSGEPVTVVDELAIDSIEEFCNVVNGLYIVNMSGKGHDMDLDMPRTLKNEEPDVGGVFQLLVETEFGRFVLYMSMDGFVFGRMKELGW